MWQWQFLENSLEIVFHLLHICLCSKLIYKFKTEEHELTQRSKFYVAFHNTIQRKREMGLITSKYHHLSLRNTITVDQIRNVVLFLWNIPHLCAMNLFHCEFAGCSYFSDIKHWLPTHAFVKLRHGSKSTKDKFPFSATVATICKSFRVHARNPRDDCVTGLVQNMCDDSPTIGPNSFVELMKDYGILTAPESSGFTSLVSLKVCARRFYAWPMQQLRDNVICY